MTLRLMVESGSYCGYVNAIYSISNVISMAVGYSGGYHGENS